MASAVAGGLFNAFAFAGAGYLFKYFDKNGYAEEAKRHNLAMESLTADREKYLEEVTDRKNKLAQLREEPTSQARAFYLRWAAAKTLVQAGHVTPPNLPKSGRFLISAQFNS
jgi:hypothetical protein